MLVILMKDVLCVLAGGEPDLGGALCFCLLCFFFFFRLFLFFLANLLESTTAILSLLSTKYERRG